MAPIKFEEQIKEKMEQRTITPSADSWSKLSERLDAEDKKSGFPIYWWLGIAAGLILMIAVVMQTFNTGPNEMILPQVVEEEQPQEKINNEQPIKEKINESIRLVNQQEEIASQKEEAEPFEFQIKNYQSVAKEQFNRKEQVATNKNQLDLQENVIKDKPNEIKSGVLEAEILKERVAEVLTDVKADKPSVADREVDSLLKLASKELLRNKIMKDATKTVDANELLQSVQDDMGQSFRSRVFEALKESYETVKTAVAERNNK